MTAPKLKLYRVKEVWKITSWAYVEANSRDEAEMMLENGEGDFDAEGADAETEYVETLGDIEEVR